MTWLPKKIEARLKAVRDLLDKAATDGELSQVEYLDLLDELSAEVETRMGEEHVNAEN